MIYFLLELLFVSHFGLTPPLQTQLPAEIQQGKTLMEQRCIKCHSMKVVQDYSPERWEKILPKMSRKAKLSPQESSTLERYILWELKRTREQK